MEEFKIGLNTEILARQKGFISNTHPTQSLLQRWLRVVHNIDIFVVACYIGSDEHKYSYYIVSRNIDNDTDGSEDDTYEEALENALLEGLELIIN